LPFGGKKIEQVHPITTENRKERGIPAIDGYALESSAFRVMLSILDRIYASRSTAAYFQGRLGNLPASVRFTAPEIIRTAATGRDRWEDAMENGTMVLPGNLRIPYTDLPLPPESRMACFELIMPRGGCKAPRLRPFCATGDEGFDRAAGCWHCPCSGTGSVR
jgi:hypothetical protein